jgi:hypothetical protein
MKLLIDEYLLSWILFFPLITSFGFFINIVEHPLLVILITLFFIIGIYCIYYISSNVKINYTHKSNFYDTDNE